MSAKKKNKQQENASGGKSSEAKPTQVRTFPNGLVIEELQMGKPNGKMADKGKKVRIHNIILLHIVKIINCAAIIRNLQKQFERFRLL